MKKTWILSLTLAFAVALGLAASLAADPAGPGPAAAPAAPAPECGLQTLTVPAAGIAPSLDLLFNPAPVELAPPCRIRCPTTECHSDSQCTAAPGGTCTPVCGSQGCCTYPA